jgi:PKD repeat protein
MIMNFMDYSDDCAMYMFTTDQVNRFHAALTLSPCRTGLTASASAICSGIATTAPVADFTYPSSICTNVAATFEDASTGPPTSWSWSVTPSATIATSTSQNPNITFPATGTYTVTLAATNTISTGSVSHVVTVTSCSVTTCDTITNFVNSDTLTIFQLPQGVSDSGYVSGNNIYGDLAKAEYYSSANLANTQIKSVIVLFFRSGTVGTKGTGTVSLDILNGNTTTGPSGTALGTATASLASIVSTTPTANVDYCGNPGLAFPSAIMIPYKFMFATPVTTPASGFFASLNLPTTTGDTLVVFQNTDFGIAHNVSTAWELNAGSPATWGDVQSDWGFNNPVSFSILPIVCPLAAGIEHNELGSNINLFPNPNNGQFNFAATLAEPTNLNFTVVNTLGQIVYVKSINNVSNTILNFDLSNLAKGIYYANITDSNNHKTVKKIIIE